MSMSPLYVPEVVSPATPDMSVDAMTDRAADYLFLKELLQGLAITLGKQS